MEEKRYLTFALGKGRLAKKNDYTGNGMVDAVTFGGVRLSFQCYLSEAICGYIIKYHA